MELTRDLRDADKDAIASLHTRTFSHHPGYASLRRELDIAIDARSVVIAKEGDTLAGFGAAYPLDTPARRDQLEAIIQHARGEDDAFMRRLEEEAARFGARASFTTYLTPGYDTPPLPGDNDTYFSTLIVAPEYRRRRIGSRLVTERIRLASERGSTHGFVECMSGSGSERIYLARGGERIARYGPLYGMNTNFLLIHVAIATPNGTLER